MPRKCNPRNRVGVALTCECGFSFVYTLGNRYTTCPACRAEVRVRGTPVVAEIKPRKTPWELRTWKGGAHEEQ